MISLRIGCVLMSLQCHTFLSQSVKMCGEDMSNILKKKKKGVCALSIMTAFKELSVNLTYLVNR